MSSLASSLHHFYSELQPSKSDWVVSKWIGPCRSSSQTPTTSPNVHSKKPPTAPNVSVQSQSCTSAPHFCRLRRQSLSNLRRLVTQSADLQKYPMVSLAQMNCLTIQMQMLTAESNSKARPSNRFTAPHFTLATGKFKELHHPSVHAPYQKRSQQFYSLSFLFDHFEDSFVSFHQAYSDQQLLSQNPDLYLLATHT